MLRPDLIQMVFVDFDDTLVDTAPRFQAARLQLFDLLAQLGFDDTSIRTTHHEEIDPGMRERFGLGPQRLEHAFRATYEHLCRSAGRPVDERIAEHCAAFGRTVAGTPPLLHGALPALRELARSMPTVLYTQAGDSAYQLSCITECGVLEVIRQEHVRICERKTTEAFRGLLDELRIAEPAHVCMIGNSMRSDINPALECGAQAIFVNVDDPWEFDVVDPIHDRFTTVRSFPEAVTMLLQARRSFAS